MENNEKYNKTRSAYDDGEIYKEPKPWQRLRYDKVAQMLPNNRDIKILDLGCREAHFGDILYELGYHNYWGIDKNQDAISFAHKKRKSGQNFILGDLLHPEIQKTYKEFDVFILMELLEHLPNDDDIRVLQSIPVGKTIIATIPVEPPLPKNREHVRGMQTIEEVNARYRFAFSPDYEIKKWYNPHLFVFSGTRTGDFI